MNILELLEPLKDSDIFKGLVKFSEFIDGNLMNIKKKNQVLHF
jgi:hypothetical protein